MKKFSSLFAAVLFATLALSACSKEKKEETSTTTTTTTTTTADTKPAADGLTGVPECDDYIAKYEKCIGDKVPEMARSAMKDAFAKTRDAWKTAAATPEGKSTLAMACKTAMEQAKTALSAYGCEM